MDAQLDSSNKELRNFQGGSNSGSWLSLVPGAFMSDFLPRNDAFGGTKSVPFEGRPACGLSPKEDDCGMMTGIPAWLCTLSNLPRTFGMALHC